MSSFSKTILPSSLINIHQGSGKGPLGVAYFDEDDESLFWGQCDAKDLKALHELKQKIWPTSIVIPTGNDEEFKRLLQRNFLDPNVPFRVIDIKKSEFSIKSAKARLSMLQVQELTTEIGLTTSTERLLHFMAVVDFSQIQAVMALGGLLGFMLKNGILNMLESPDEPVAINSISPIQWASYMQVDKMTMYSLSIYVDEEHPGATRRTKQGLSLFGIINENIKTKGGARLLKRWFNFPSRNLEVLNRRLDHVEYFLQSGHEDLIAELRSTMIGIKDINSVLSRFQAQRATIKDWTSLFSTLQAGTALQSIIGRIKGAKVPILSQVQNTKDEQLNFLNACIQETIDFQSSDQFHIAIVAGIHEELDEQKSVYDNLDTILSRIALFDVQNGLLPAAIQPELFKIVYFPQLGYLLQVPISDGQNNHSEDFTPIEGLTLHFKTEEHAYYKNFRMDELDEKLGDVQGKIDDFESTIIRRLENEVIQLIPRLQNLGEAVYELDCLLAFSLFAHEKELVRPTLNDTLELEIEGGWHILQNLVVDLFVPNSTSFGSDDNRVHVITGPNGSGKSVYMKQVLLIVYMAQIGSFVSAKAATIGLCDKLLTRLRSVQSITSSLSTFTSDSSQIAYLIRTCTPRSICLIDEYGKGTIANDGIALLAAIIRMFQSWNRSSPRVMIATHFHELFTRRIIQENVDLCFYHMEFMLAESVAADSTSPASVTSIDSRNIFASTSAALVENRAVQSSSRHPQSLVPQVLASGSDNSEVSRGALSRPPHNPPPLNMQDLIFLYKLKRGAAVNSFGFHCALRAGLQLQFVQRAKEVSQALATRRQISPIIHLQSNAPKNAQILQALQSLPLAAAEPSRKEGEDGPRQDADEEVLNAMVAAIHDFMKLLGSEKPQDQSQEGGGRAMGDNKGHDLDAPISTSSTPVATSSPSEMGGLPPFILSPIHHPEQGRFPPSILTPSALVSSPAVPRGNEMPSSCQPSPRPLMRPAAPR